MTSIYEIPATYTRYLRFTLVLKMILAIVLAFLVQILIPRLTNFGIIIGVVIIPQIYLLLRYSRRRLYYRIDTDHVQIVNEHDNKFYPGYGPINSTIASYLDVGSILSISRIKWRDSPAIQIKFRERRDAIIPVCQTDLVDIEQIFHSLIQN
jgi:hypothetical protein